MNLQKHDKKKKTFFYGKKLSVSLERKRMPKTVVFIYGIVGGCDIGELYNPNQRNSEENGLKALDRLMIVPRLKSLN